MKGQYFSFLITSHEDGKLVAAYVNGMPIGQIQNGEFKPHGFVYPKGEPVLVNINNLPDPFPFKSLDEMKATLHQLIDKLEIVEDKEVKS